MSEAATLVTVMRHGAVAGATNVLRGWQDAPLSEAGWQQLHAACAALDSPVTHIAASTLVRCSAFAQAYATQHALPLMLQADLREINFGDWENLTPDAAQAATPTLFAKFQNQPEGTTPPAGEPFDVFKLRVLSAFDACLSDARGGHLLLLTHAGVMRVLLTANMRLPWATTYRIALPPAGSFRLSCLRGHAPYLLNLNPVCAT